VVSETDQAAARELIIKLAGLPLALDQAGAFIEETPSSPIEYVPDQIPEEIFINGTPVLGENLEVLATNTLQRTQIIGQACRFSLLCRDAISKNLSIHRQFQAVLRGMMVQKGEGVWAKCAVRAMSRVFPDPEKFSTWPMCETMLPHALELCRVDQRLCHGVPGSSFTPWSKWFLS
jgi:hypothetical protein